MKTLAIVVSATLLAWPIAATAQVKVLMSGGFSGAYEQLLPEFERTSGIKVTTGSGASQGSGPQTIGAQLASGVAADVVILSREGLDVNAGAKIHRFAGAKIHQRCWQEGPRTGGLFVRHQAWIGLSAGVSELARRERCLL
jgi:hypothetical protein